MDLIDGIIVGAATAAIGTIIAMKLLNSSPEGGGQPGQPVYSANPEAGYPAPLYVVPQNPNPVSAAPMQQTVPITEAAYNQYPVTHEAAFGMSVNQPAQEAVLPQ